MKRLNTISAHIVQFCRFLRKHKFSIGPTEEVQVLETLNFIPFHNPHYFKNALSAILVKDKSQMERFDDLYLQYWSEVRKGENAKIKEYEREKPKKKQKQKAPTLQVLKQWLYGEEQKEKIEMASYSSEETFLNQDFSEFAHEDIRESLYYTNELAKRLSNKKGRRFEKTSGRIQFDMRKIIRNNLLRSDEIIRLNFRKKKIEKLKIVVLCDVSRSMEFYAKFLIHFLYGLNRASTRIETFVFSTQIERITKNLKDYEFERVLESLKDSFDYWSGGTKIGFALQQFNEKYANQILDYKSKVIILSDGWDTGDIGLVEEAMAHIKRKCDKIIWLNPLASNPNFRPEVGCLKAAMPYIDIFEAANSIEGLKDLILKIR